MTFTSKEKAAEAEREVKQREWVYPRRVAAEKMTQAAADKQIAVMREIAADYRMQAEAEERQGDIVLMAEHDNDEGCAYYCKGTVITVCENCKAVHIGLVDHDGKVVAVTNVSFTSWMEVISDTFDDIERIDGKAEQPAAEGAVH